MTTTVTTTANNAANKAAATTNAAAKQTTTAKRTGAGLLTTAMMILFAVLGGLTTAVAVRAQGSPNCTPPGGGAVRSVYYTSCFVKAGSDPDDTNRLKAAITAIPSGKLIFNEGSYSISDTLNLKSYLTLEGTSTNNLTGIPPSSSIKMTVTNKAIFKIGPTVYDVAIRDLGLTATSATGTVGILGEGSLPDASLNFEFSNLRFSGLAYGIKVQALDSGHGFQFDNVKVEHCSFEGDTTGIYVDSYNSGWQMHSLEFYMGANAVGIEIVRIAYSDIDSLIGNGQAPGLTPAKVLVRIKEHANLHIGNTVSEGVEYDLKVEGISPNYPIHLDNNTFQDKVDVAGATIYATSNQYGLQYTGAPSPLPVARDSTRVFSYGEKFCFEGSTSCATAGWQFLTGGFMVSSSDINRSYWSRPSLFENTVSVNTDDPYNPLTSPLVSIIAPTYSGKALLRLGHPLYNYTLTRNGTNGWLDFAGNQAAPYTGYSFNGPVKLPDYKPTTLPTVLADGALVYCSTCQPNTTPCAGGGSGALAISIGSQWVCK